MNRSVRSSASAIQHARVMLIEDHIDTTELVLSLLRDDVGVTYCGARPSGESFFTWFRTSGILRVQPALRHLDLILLDINLPGEDGFALVPQIRQIADLHDVRIVILSATSDVATVQRARTAGCDGFLSKPINVSAFPEQIRRILRGEMLWMAS